MGLRSSRIARRNLCWPKQDRSGAEAASVFMHDARLVRFLQKTSSTLTPPQRSPTTHENILLDPETPKPQTPNSHPPSHKPHSFSPSVHPPETHASIRGFYMRGQRCLHRKSDLSCRVPLSGPSAGGAPLAHDRPPTPSPFALKLCIYPQILHAQAALLTQGACGGGAPWLPRRRGGTLRSRRPMRGCGGARARASWGGSW